MSSGSGPAHHRHDLTGIEVARLLLNLRQILRLHLFGRTQQVLERVFQQRRVHHPPAGLIAFGELPQRIGGGERKGHAGGGAADIAEQAARRFAEQAAEQLAPKLFEVLRSEPDARSGDEFLDVALVEFDAVGLADALHHLDLQGDDGQRRPRLRQ